MRMKRLLDASSWVFRLGMVRVIVLIWIIFWGWGGSVLFLSDASGQVPEHRVIETPRCLRQMSNANGVLSSPGHRNIRTNRCGGRRVVERAGPLLIPRISRQPGGPLIPPAVFVNDPLLDTPPHIVQGSPTLAMDPFNPRHMISLYLDTGGSSQTHLVGWSETFNEGTSWQDRGELPLTEPSVESNDGLPVLDVDVGRKKIVGVVLDRDPTQMKAPASIAFYEYDLNLGKWTRTVLFPRRNRYDHPWVKVDNGSGSSCQGCRYVVATEGNGKIMFMRDCNGTWEGPWQVNGTHAGCDNGASMALDPRGRIYIAFEHDSNAAMQCRQSCKDRGIEVVWSDDCGKTWEPVIGAETVPNSVACIVRSEDPGSARTCGTQALKGPIAVRDFPFIIVDPLDPTRVAVGFHADPDGAVGKGDTSDIFFFLSEDAGATFFNPVSCGTPTVLGCPINLKQTNDQFLPTLSVAPNGCLLMTWYDRRHDPNNERMHLRARVSCDPQWYWQDSAAVNDFRLSDDFPRPYPIDDRVDACYMTDYNFAVHNGKLWKVVYTDASVLTDPLALHPVPPVIEIPRSRRRYDGNIGMVQTADDSSGTVSIGIVDTSVAGDDGDGVLEPCEAANLNIKILNEGTTALTGVKATLVSLTPDVSVVTGTSDYPDLPVGTSAFNTTPFQIAVEHTVTCGQPLDFRLDVTSNEGNDSTFVQVNAGNEVALISTDFNSSDFASWTVQNNDGNGVIWKLENDGSASGRNIYSEPYPIIDDDAGGSGNGLDDDELISPAVDASSCNALELTYRSYANVFDNCSTTGAPGCEVMDTDVRSTTTGGIWKNVHRIEDRPGTIDDETADVSIDVTAYKGANFQVRFHYYNAVWEYYWAVDDFDLYCQSCNVCTHHPGEAGTRSPLIVTKSGSNLVFSWGKPSIACNPTDYAVYVGDLTTLRTTGYSHNTVLTCSAGGTSYTISLSDPRIGAASYFLVVATDGASEGSYGKKTDGTERPVSAAACVATQDLNSC